MIPRLFIDGKHLIAHDERFDSPQKPFDPSYLTHISHRGIFLTTLGFEPKPISTQQKRGQIISNRDHTVTIRTTAGALKITTPHHQLLCK